MNKLAIFLSSLDGGGAERVMLNLAYGFAIKGIHVDLLLVKAEGPYLAQIPSNINLINFNKSKLFQSLPTLIRYIRKESPTALISALEDTNFIMLWACRLAGSRTQSVVTVHNQLSIEAKHATQLKRKLTPTLVSYFYPWADKVVAVSKGVAADLMQIGVPKEKIDVIYNPILTDDLTTKLQESVEHPWLKPGEPPVILAVGRLTEQKDYPSLLRAFARARQLQKIKLIILGEGEDRVALEALAHTLNIADDIDFPGFVSNPYAYMAKATALILTSAWEGFGNVLVEAMAAGTSVIATNCKSGPAEILAHGEYGSLVQVADIEGIASAITNVIHSPSESLKLKKRASDFSLKAALEKYQKVLSL
ncbi:glycosyltransferase [Adonisia turfae]|uniref:Glycosyltransferase n=1 Tax=Adonisia turfae CCMR0081 TaxID=2292702 RepID=A0A6M0RF74_9CYAN|nr:glycosyltransferase [Adonisia turfae]NEZ54412.1 glycosyltransferase [Adonisia turfae CCMR0081]